MSNIIKQINKFFTDLFGNIGKWVMLGVFGILFILAIVLIILAIANIKQVLGYGFLIFALIASIFYIYKLNK